MDFTIQEFGEETNLTDGDVIGISIEEVVEEVNITIEEYNGATGQDGEQGIQGVKGDKGDKGEDGSNGIQSIVPGDNITIDNTDPLNPIISAEDGGTTVTKTSDLSNDGTDGINPFITAENLPDFEYFEFQQIPFTEEINLSFDNYMPLQTLNASVEFSEGVGSLFGKASFARLTGGSVSFPENFIKLGETIYDPSKENIITFWKEYDKVKYIIENTIITDVIPPNQVTGVSAMIIDPTSVTVSWSAGTDNVGVESYDLYMNGIFLKSTINTTTSVNGLTPNSEYSFYVVAKDAEGNQSINSEVVIVIPSDTSSPSQPANLTSTSITTTTIGLSWSASTDNVGVISYDVYMDGVLKSNVSSTTATIEGLTAATTYAFYVVAKDNAGNISANSLTLNVATATIQDVSSPTAPTNLEATNITSSGLTLSWVASTDDIGVTGYDVYVDGVFKIASTNTNAAIGGLTGSTTYSLTVRAKDSVGNESAASAPLGITTISSEFTEAIIQQTYEAPYTASSGYITNASSSTPSAFTATTEATKVVEITINGSGVFDLYRWTTGSAKTFLGSVSVPLPNAIVTVKNLSLNLPAGTKLSIKGKDANSKLGYNAGAGGTYIDGALNNTYVVNFGYKTGIPAYIGVHDVSKFTHSGSFADGSIADVFVNQYGTSLTQKTVTEIYIKGSGDFDIYSVINNANPVLLGTVNSPNAGVENIISTSFTLPANARLGIKRKFISTALFYGIVQNDIAAFKIGSGIQAYCIFYGYKVI